MVAPDPGGLDPYPDVITTPGVSPGTPLIREEPHNVGQLGAYVAAVDGELRRPEVHAPTIGILLCTGKSAPTVQYSLASTSAPVAVADYRGLPDDARAALPTAGELEAVIEQGLDDDDGS